MLALAFAPAMLSQNSHAVLPTTNGLMAFSALMLSGGTMGASKKTMSLFAAAFKGVGST